MRMNTLLKTALIFTIALLSVNVVRAQKVDKKAARIAAFRKMVDTADFRIIMEKASPKGYSQITLSGTPSLSISGGVAQSDVPYYGGDLHQHSGERIKFNSTNFDYASQHVIGETSPYKYNMIITPKAGATDMADLDQIVISVVTEDIVQVQYIFKNASIDPIGFTGYILKYKKQD